MNERLKVGLISLSIVLLCGVLPSILTSCWGWFGRSGALLVIYGVAITWYNFNHEYDLGKAFSDIHKTIEKNENNDDMDGQKKIISGLHQFFKSYMKINELLVICVGTLIWGYGDLAQKLLS